MNSIKYFLILFVEQFNFKRSDLSRNNKSIINWIFKQVTYCDSDEMSRATTRYHPSRYASVY